MPMYVDGRRGWGRIAARYFWEGYALRMMDRQTVTERVRTILARKYPSELVKPAFCIRCFRDLPEGKSVCARCGFWNGDGNEPDLFWRPGGRKL